MTSTDIKAIVFDLGGVLIDWNPRHMYRTVFEDEAEMEHFLGEIATLEWNSQHDAGVRWADGVAQLSEQHPEYAGLIEMYMTRWTEMLNGPIDGTVAILAELKKAGYEVHALTNWSSETFPIALERYDFLGWFEDIVVSGDEKIIKPDPRIYEILLERVGRNAYECVFIDDSPANIEAARKLGLVGIPFHSPEQLAGELAALGVTTD
ncbi:MAG: HAD family phosphatase [bacterium]|nr:HAD family phosphatase [bacterium]MCP4966993.1 HAD family phosphatase [bacterium]